MSRTPISNNAPGGCRPDQHGQVLGHCDASDRMTNRVPDVCIADAVLSGWPTDPHLDNLACRTVCVNKCCLPSRNPASMTSPACRSSVGRVRPRRPDVVRVPLEDRHTAYGTEAKESDADLDKVEIT